MKHTENISKIIDSKTGKHIPQIIGEYCDNLTTEELIKIYIEELESESSLRHNIINGIEGFIINERRYKNHE